MNTALQFLSAPLAMCLILVGIHCYLGLHVLARGVIFVDLALAQVAALGTTIAFLFGFEHDSFNSYLASLVATFFAAYFFSLANQFHKKISLEAMIGITYAFAAAIIILLIDKMSHGSEHLKYVLVGQIMWVSWEDVAKTAITYFFVSLVHFIFRKQLIANSFEQKNDHFWDFIFYALFGVVITSSVHVSGVLLVFSFLIVPSIMGTVFFQTLKARLLFGWALGFVLCTSGMYLSYKLDSPPGALIVVIFTAVPILTIPILKLRRNVGSQFLANKFG